MYTDSPKPNGGSYFQLTQNFEIRHEIKSYITSKGENLKISNFNRVKLLITRHRRRVRTLISSNSSANFSGMARGIYCTLRPTGNYYGYQV